jgi:serine/threonine protein kinase/WD40 repeat protein
MNPSHEREQALFILASAKLVEERPAFLARECGGDKALRARLEALLAAHEQPEPILDGSDRAAKATMKLVFSDPPDESIGQKIGRYKLLEKVGEGGCGVVYVAEQTEPVRRRVALKVIKLGMDTRQVVARFEAERQALAMMDHPSIAKVLDAGTTDSQRSTPNSQLSAGRPFFVMELVRGIKITDYCDQNHLSTPERLDLFIRVCQAIQHAHQKGIIHRDIKPSNILVTLHDGVPVPKVIDFGIAKAIEGKLTDATVYTQLQQFIGTPAYMSPEQAEMSGLDIDTRSDIYSLGVLLYELLTGKTPFDAQELMSQGIDAMRKTIREKEPARPSTRLGTLQGDELTTTAKRRSVETSRLASLLRGDLDWIVMKCLEKDRTRRYETANGLGVDIKRHLNNETVVARPPSSAYRFQKLVRRNKLVVAAMGGVAAALLLGTVISAWQAVRATQASREALAARQKAIDAQAGEKEQRQKAEALAVEIEKSYQTARQNLYAADMATAARALKENDFARTRQLLDAQRPKPGEEDLRGIEWRYLWAASEGDQIAALDAGPTAVTTVDVSPDGKLIAAGCENGQMKVWDSASLKVVATLPNTNQNSGCRDVHFAPAGNVLATCYYSGLTLWDTTSLKPLREISVGQLRNNNLAFSPDGKFMAVATRDSPTLFYDTATGEKLPSLPEGVIPPGSGGTVAFSRDGTRMATGHGSLKIWDVASRRLIRSFDSGEPLAICFSADGGSVFTSEFSGAVRLWNVSDGANEAILSGQEGFYSRLGLSPDGVFLAGGGSQIELWNWRERQLLRVFRGHESAIRALAFTPDGGIVVSGSADGTVRLWSTQLALAPATNSIARVKVFWSGNRLCQFSPNGKWLAAPGEEGIQMVDVERRRVTSLLPGVKVPIGFVSFLPHGHTLLVLDISPTNQSIQGVGTAPSAPEPAAAQIKLWDWEASTVQAIPLRHLPPSRATALALSPDGTQMALTVMSPDEHSHLLCSVNPRTGEGACLPLNLSADATAGLAFSPDAHQLAVSDKNQTLLCHWPQVTNFIALPSKACVQKPFFSRDGARLMTDDMLGEVRLWEVPSGKLLFVLASDKMISSGSFSADVLTLSTAHGDTSRAWNLRTRRELIAFDDTREIEFSPDGRVIARIRADTTLYLAHLPALHDIEHPQPATLAQLAEAAKSPAGVFEPVTRDAALVREAAK